VDGRLLVGQDEEPDLVLADQDLDLVDDLDRVADPIVAPELPLRAEAAGERAAVGEIRNGDPCLERNGDVFRPVEDPPVGDDRVDVRDRRGGRGRDNLPVDPGGDPADRSAITSPTAVLEAANEVEEHRLPFAADHDVDPRCFGEHLGIEEDPVHATERGERLGTFLADDLEHALGLGDRGGDRGRGDGVGGVGANPLPKRVLVEMIGRRIEEGDLGIARCLRVAREICDPRGLPVAGDLRTTGMVVRINGSSDGRRGSGWKASRFGLVRTREA